MHDDDINDRCSAQKHMELKINKTLDDYNNILNRQVISMMGVSFVGCSYERKELELRFESREWEMNPNGSMHGGIIATAFDTAFGYLAHYFADSMVVTVSINTMFLKPVMCGDSMIVKCRALSVGRSIISIAGDALLEKNGVCAASATATFMPIRKRGQ